MRLLLLLCLPLWWLRRLCGSMLLCLLWPMLLRRLMLPLRRRWRFLWLRVLRRSRALLWLCLRSSMQRCKSTVARDQAWGCLLRARLLAQPCLLHGPFA